MASLYDEVHGRVMRDYLTGVTISDPVPPNDEAAVKKLMDNFNELQAAGVKVAAAYRAHVALLYMAGYKTFGRRCPEGALSTLSPLLNLLEDVQVPNLGPVDPETMQSVDLGMRVHSLAAFAYYTKYVADKDGLWHIKDDAKKFPRAEQSHPADPLDNLIRAVKHANVAARWLFTSQAVLMAGFAFKGLARSLGLNVWQFKEYAPLWRALERAELRVAHEWPAQIIVPPADRCAAPGCNRSADRWRLSLCQGECPRHLKPWYCGTNCAKSEAAQQRHPHVLCEGLISLPPPPTVLGPETGAALIRGLKTHGPVVQTGLMYGNFDRDPLRDGKIIHQQSTTTPAWLPATAALCVPVKVVRKLYP